MKKNIVILLIIYFVAMFYCEANNLSIPTITNTEQKETQRLEKLKLLQAPEYVQNELKQVGKLIVLESSYNYFDEVTDKGFMDWTIRQIMLDLNYKFALGIDLKYIKVRSIVDKIIVIQIPKNWIALQYIQLDTENSMIVDGDRMFLASQFKPSHVQIILEQSQNNVANKIESNDELRDKALENLKNELEGLIKSLGYEEVIFEIV